jgi:hypothetical protein
MKRPRWHSAKEQQAVSSGDLAHGCSILHGAVPEATRASVMTLGRRVSTTMLLTFSDTPDTLVEGSSIVLGARWPGLGRTGRACRD